MSVVAILLSKSFAAFPGYARRAADQVALPFGLRAAHAFLFLGLLALPLLVVALLLVARRTPGRADRPIIRCVLAWLALIAAGALVAATDASNGRGWNPALYGAVFTAASFPAALAAGLRRDDERRTGPILCAVIAAFPITLLIAAVGPILIEWALRHGWPVGW